MAKPGAEIPHNWEFRDGAVVKTIESMLTPQQARELEEQFPGDVIRPKEK